MDRLSSHRATKDVVEKHGFKFSKSLGQNFLIDDNVIDTLGQISDNMPNNQKEGADYVTEPVAR